MDFRKNLVAAAALTIALGPAYAIADYTGAEQSGDTQILAQAGSGTGGGGTGGGGTGGAGGTGTGGAGTGGAGADGGGTTADEAEPGAQESPDEPTVEDGLAEDPAEEPGLDEPGTDEPGMDDPAMDEEPGVDDGLAEDPAAEQPTAAAGEQFIDQPQPGTTRVDQLMNQNVVGAQGEDLGTVNDILISQDGQVEGLVISSGGFLGIGDKQIAVPWDQVEMQPDQEELRTQLTEQQIADAPEFQDQAGAGAQQGTGAQEEPGMQEEPMEQETME